MPALELNRVTGVEEELDLDAVAEVYAGKPHLVSLPPWVEGLDEQLEARGYTRGYAWVKFERGPDPAPPVESALRIEETTDAEHFGATVGEGVGAPQEAAPGVAPPGRHRLHSLPDSADGVSSAAAGPIVKPP